MTRQWWNLAARTRRRKQQVGGHAVRPARGFLPRLEPLEERVVLDNTSAGANGINARATALTGFGVSVGMVEPGRPGMPGFDDDTLSHEDVTPVEVALRNGPAHADDEDEIGRHAQAVAGIIVADGATDQGVARQASFYASASDGMVDDALAFQHLVGLADGELRVMNYSSGQYLNGRPRDGNSLLTQFMDWSARKHNVLYVVAGLQTGNPWPAGKDEYNGLTVAATSMVGGVYRRIYGSLDPNQAAAGGRGMIDLAAPGDRILTTLRDNQWDRWSGTSFAAPHVAGAAALLHEYANGRVAAGADRWTTVVPGTSPIPGQGYKTAQDHRVIKAVLMNSADKLAAAGHGKTIVKKDGVSNWSNTEAQPLDPEMGAGQVNVGRAVQQFAPGQYSWGGGAPAARWDVPAIGWDFQKMTGTTNNRKYKFDRPLAGGSYVSITLVWDRNVAHNDRNGDGKFNADESFVASPLANLDLYLVPKGGSINQALRKSVSIGNNVEHIFFQLPADQAGAAPREYEFWVRQPNEPIREVEYAVAWWAVAGPAAGGAGVRGRVWQDTNTPGIREPDERGLAGVVASLYTSGGSLVAQATTDVYGGYQFTSLAAGDYYVSFAGQSGYSFSPQDQGSDDTIDSDVTAFGQKAFTVSSTSDLTFDAGLAPWSTGVVSGRAFLDLAHDGVDGSGDAPAPGLAVALFTSDGEQVASTTTDPAGYYAFSGVGPGGYRVGFAPASGYTFTDKDAGSDDTIDSDAYVSGVTDEFTLALGQNRNDVGAGLVQTASVGDRVWVDANDNGVQDVGELALPYAQVELYTSAGDLVATTLSDSDGYYGFAALVPGQYYLGFTAPSGYRLASRDQGYDDAADSDPDPQGRTADFTLAPGVTVSTWDAGMVPVPASGTVGDRVWEDTDGDGRQDFDEPGVAGVEVRLLSVAGGAVLATTTTNADGAYSFTSVVPGDYKVEFVKPEGRTFTTLSLDEDPRLDSDADLSTGRTAAFTLALGEANLDLDAGLLSSTVQYGSAGDRLWLDADRDGLQGPSEAGVAGATVHLLDGDGYWLRTTETGEGGAYSFVNLPPGDYSVQFARPDGHQFTFRDRGGNDALDSDADPDTGRTAKFTLAAGAALSGLDAGVYVVPPAPTVSGVSPDQGYTSGGLSVIISGTNFTYVDQVYFGTVLAASFTVNSPGQITAKTPAHQAGTFDVTVVTAGGTSNSGRFTFVAAPAPTVTSLDVRSGPTYGGTVVSISGNHFLGATQVKFGDTAASFQVSSDTLILATSPAHAAGLVHVSVVTPSGTSEQTSADGFTYVPPPPPVVAGLNPGSGPGRGGTVVTLHGSNFTGATAVQFGTSTATGVQVLNGSTLVATSPAHAVGVVYVKVVTLGGTSAAVEAGRFTYNPNPPLVTGVTPNTDTASGGRVVTITGEDFPSNFTASGTVKFGDVVVGREGILGASGTAITVYAPPHAAGVVHVTVTTPQGTSATSSASLFEYTPAVAPSVTSVSPASGFNTGGRARLRRAGAWRQRRDRRIYPTSTPGQRRICGVVSSHVDKSMPGEPRTRSGTREAGVRSATVRGGWHYERQRTPGAGGGGQHPSRARRVSRPARWQSAGT